MAGEYDEYEDETYYGGGSYPMGGALTVLGGERFTTPEALEYARKILKRTVDNDDQTEEDAYLESVRSKADTVRQALRQAREKLAAEEYGHQDFWLAAAQGFGAPTRTGSFGETLGTVAGNLREPLAKRRDFNLNKQKSLLELDLGLAGVDEDLLAAQLEMMKLRGARDRTLSSKALEIMGRRVGDQTKLQNQATAAVDREMAKDYVEFIQTGASDAAKALEELGMARDHLRGFRVDPETGEEVSIGENDSLTGPVVGTVSNLPWIGKTVQDVVFPESSDVQETVEYTVQRSLRPILGAQFTKEEGERLISRVYNPRLDEKTNAARLDRLIKQLQRAYDAKVAAARYFETHGTMRGFRGKLRWSVDDIWTPEDNKIGVKPRPSERSQNDALDEVMTFPTVEEEPVLQYEDLIPAGEGYAEGGEVDASGRIRHEMPDGRFIWGPPEVPYERILQRYAEATGQTFDEPIPSEDEEIPEEIVEEETDAYGFSPGVSEAIDLGGSALGYGLLGAMGGRYGTKLSHGLADLIPGHKASSAETRVLAGLENEGITPDEWVKLVQKAQRLGVPATAMDMGGIELRALGEASMNPRNKETRDFYQTLLERQAATRGRVEDQVNKSLKPDDYFAMQKKLKKDLQTNAKPLYAELYRKYPALKSESLMQLLETPSGKKAVKNAVKAVRDRPGATLGKQDAMGMVTKPSLEFLDQVKDELDDMITKEEMKGGVYKATKRGKRLRELRNALRNEVDTLTTDPKTGESAYKAARAQYSGDLEIMDALRFGREDFMKFPPGEIEQAVSEMNFSERDALRTGVAQSLFERIGKVGKRVNPADKIIDTPEMQEKLKLLFDKPNEYKIFKEALDLESRIFDESQSTIRKGRSALSTTRDPKDNILRRTAKKAPTLGVFSPTQWAIRWLRRSEPVSQKEAAEIIRILRTSDPKELAKLERKLRPKYGRELKRKKRVGRAAMAGAAIGALASLYQKYFGDEEPEASETAEADGYARGGLVRSKKPDWQTVTEQILDSITR